MTISKKIAKLLMASGFFMIAGLFADGVPVPPDATTVPANSTTAVAGVAWEAKAEVQPVNSIIAKGDMVWLDELYQTDSLGAEYQSTWVSVSSNVSGSNRKAGGAGQIVRIFGREANDVNGSKFQLSSYSPTGEIGATIPFEIHTLKGVNLISPPSGPVAPGGVIINTTTLGTSAALTQGSDTLRQDIYGLIEQGTPITAGTYTCNLICKNYQGP